MHPLASLLLMLLACTFADPDPLKLLGKTLTNLPEVAASVGFSNARADPYPTLWYDTHIDKTRDCFVVYPSTEDRTHYQLKSYNAEELAQVVPGTAFKTHYGACGVCSTMDDLVVYITKPDLTTPVRRCALQTFGVVGCLQRIGFTETCSRIWAYNAANTRKMQAFGGCLGTCLAHIFTPNNVPSGTYNPCEPLASLSSAAAATPNPMESAPAAPAVGPSAATSAGVCEGGAAAGEGGKGSVTADGRKQSKGYCGNTINGKPACIAEQWQDGLMRLNPCLQCDECRSGPIFQKVAGRTRRASGIHSAIERPGVKDLTHDYA